MMHREVSAKEHERISLPFKLKIVELKCCDEELEISGVACSSGYPTM